MKKIIKIFDPAVGVQEKKILEKTFRSHFWSSGLGIGNVSIFEEVTSTLDYEMGLAIIASIKEQSREVTILHIAYRITTLIIVIKLKF